MSIKDIIILILAIVLVGAILFGSLGNFLGVINGVMDGVTNTVNSNEGYVYNGGPIDSLSSEDSDSSDSSIVDGSTSSSSGNGGLLGMGSGSDDTNQGSSSSSSSSSSDVKYEEYQKDYETGMVDSQGNPIYLSIVSTNGGQMEPGIYQVYWSSEGPINQTRIG